MNVYANEASHALWCFFHALWCVTVGRWEPAQTFHRLAVKWTPEPLPEPCDECGRLAHENWCSR